jgi:hypothetical protein
MPLSLEKNPEISTRPNQGNKRGIRKRIAKLKVIPDNIVILT